MTKLEEEMLVMFKAIALTGRIEYHTFPPPEYFAKEMASYIERNYVKKEK